MKKALPIIAVIVVAGLAVGGWVFLKRGGQVAPEGGVVQEAPAPEEKGFTGKLKDALTLGQAMKCTWERDKSNFGTAYIKNNKVNTDVTYEGKRMHSIMADNCTYAWEEGKTSGFKFCFEPEEGEETEAVSEGLSTMEAPDINYRCVPMVVSDATFTPPANVEFTSPLEMMGQ